jgi:hypothetical protein
VIPVKLLRTKSANKFFTRVANAVNGFFAGAANAVNAMSYGVAYAYAR